MKKIYFLFKNKSSIKIFMYYIKNKISNIFSKRKIVRFKKKHQLLLQQKKITHDFFSSHAYNFFYLLNRLKPNFNYLEIGSYEGNSALFIANSFPETKIYCVDNWVGTEEYSGNLNFSQIELNFDHNLGNYKNIVKIKSMSDKFFKKNNIIFDVIYVDGYHLGNQVYKDCVNAWKYLKEDGLLICDDFIWGDNKNIINNPCFAINQFLKDIKGFYKLEKVSNSQIFIKKMSYYK
jgi:predicted O-methyltransferase YrrM